MSVAHLLTLSATLLRRTADPAAADEYGNPGWSIASQPVAVEVQQETSGEDNESAVMVSTWRCFLDPSVADVRGWDGVEIDGVTYEVDGDAWPVRNPRTGRLSHVEARIRRVV